MRNIRVRSRPEASTTPPAVDPVRSRTRNAASTTDTEPPEAGDRALRIRRHAAPKEAPQVIDSPARTVVASLERRIAGELVEHEAVNISTPVPFEGPHATVSVGAKATWQPVAYESLSVNVSLWLPCHPTHEDVERTYREASAWVEDKVRREVALANGIDPDLTTTS